MATLHLVGAGLLVLILFRIATTWNRRPLPPGPKGRFPLLGMTCDMPTEMPWAVMTDWARKYGPLMHFRVGLQDFIIISDGNIARDLFDKKSAQYSSRPPSEVGDIISLGMRSVLMPYGGHWRRVRRIFANVVTAKKCDSYLKYQEGEAIATLQSIREDSSRFIEDVHRYSLSVARTVAFGKRVPSSSDPFATKTKKLMENFAEAMTPGKYLFEAVPQLRKLPRFMQPWLPLLEQMRDVENDFSLQNYQDALIEAEKHPDRPCIAKDFESFVASGEVTVLQAATTCMEILGAGSDTTANSILFVILGCMANPEVQSKAHEELDRVIGTGRFPTWNDEPNLPYIRAIIKEQQRWRCIAPMSFPHWSNQEDTYNGYRIPKDAVVRVNTWAIHMDENRYPHPNEFQPERFINHTLSASAYANSSNADQRDHFAYGGGKRICVGLHLAERSLFNMVSRLLHAFEILPPVDDKGRTMKVDVDDMRTALIMSPNPFQARFKVRNDEIARSLDREWNEKIHGLGESWD